MRNIKRFINSLIILFGFAPILAFAQKTDKGVRFETGISWEQIKQEAKAENKFIFVDCYATWCGPCKKMDQEVYQKITVGEYMNQHFISVKMQMDTSKAEDDATKRTYADAHAVMVGYNVKSFPTFLFFSPNANLVTKGNGYLADSNFVALAKDAVSPDKQYYSLIEEYKAGHKDYSKMPWLINEANRVGEFANGRQMVEDYIKNYLPSLNEKELCTKDNLLIIGSGLWLIDSKNQIFQWIAHHAKETDSIVGSKTHTYAKQLISAIINREDISQRLWLDIKKRTPFTTTPNWQEMKQNIQAKYGGNYADSLISPAQINFYETLKDWDQYADYIESAIKKYPPKINGRKFSHAVGGAAIDYRSPANDAWGLNHIAWTIFEGSNDKRLLKKAVNWSNLSIKNVNGTSFYLAQYFDTKANLLYRLGKTNSAIACEKEALAITPNDKDLTATLIKMKQGLPTWPKDSNKN
ncbi:thioredoxin family protein [Mucilaginibacter sp. BJC16-A38]|uniref:thioredoxin family protein n=1 Tax=Mucilaginibacter phenanthrenivorans TaxID=1234842 RepID=UPI002157422D|nr:thioredoxin family protein [Mucilaginibacter phenanthrenivorans]MCR8556988.1 thioredoxin family protein [Mucilaginibacter phenanthrenivorans]